MASKYFKPAAVALIATLSWADGLADAPAISASDAARQMEGVTQFATSAAMWVWTDKVVYQPGEPLTVRWTVKANNDFYPYTIVAFRQNNQTGQRFFLPGVQNSPQTPSDIFGNTIEAGFRITRIPEANKQIIVGAGGTLVSSTVAIPEEFGMHTIVVQLRDYTGTRVVKSAYWKFGVVRAFEDLTGNITANRTLTNDRAYRLRGIVTVRQQATVTIEPGTFIIGQPGSQPPSALLVSTEGRLVANGTRTRPIIMTSSQPVGSRQRGDWGGLIMLGRARVNDPGGSLQIEGLPDLPETRYGGTDDNHDCGSLRYVRVEFAGSLLRPNEETNSFTWGACGVATRGEYLQAHYGLDDSFEWFGGSNDAKYLVGTYGADDYIDGQIGWRGRIQHVLAVGNDDLSNRAIEMDNYERQFDARPLGKPFVYNATFVGGGNRGFDEADSPCIFLRRGAGGVYANLLCFNWISRTLGGANFDSMTPNITSGDLAINGVLSWDNGRNVATGTPRANTLTDQVVPEFRTPVENGRFPNFVIANPMLRRPLERSDPDFRPMLGSPVYRANWIAPPDDGFLDQWANYIGAFGDVDWTEEWTTFHQEQDLRP